MEKINEREFIMSSKITLEDLILCTPFDTDERRNFKNIYPGFLTEELFINEFYVEPSINTDNIADEDDSQDDINFKMELSTLSNPVTINEFETSLMTESIDPLFIRGYSGTGKTTFINSYLYKLKKNNKNNHSVILNMQDTLHSVNLFKQEWENSRYRKNVYKLYSLLLEYIGSEMNIKKDKENEKQYRTRLECIYTNYIERFSEMPSKYFKNIFSVINMFIQKNINYYNDFEDSFCLRMYNEITKLVSFDDNEEALLFSINKLLLFINVFLFCSSGNDDKYFIVLDNIENYIDKDIVYEQDIVSIVNLFRESFDAIENYFSNNNLRFSKNFKTVIVIRDTTQNMIKPHTRHTEDTPVRFIDVSALYDINKIREKKICYFYNNKNTGIYADEIRKNTIEPGKHIIDMMDSILSDINLKIFIPNLYNHNKRRITIYLIRAIKKNKEMIDKYYELLEKTKAIEHKKTINAYKNGARSIVKRILFDLIQSGDAEKNKQRYFSRIITVNLDNSIGLGYARRILVYLDNKISDNNSNEYVGFYTLIRDVFETPYDNKLPNNTIKNVSKILEVLFDGDLERTLWCQLIVLRFEEPIANADNIERAINEQYNNKKDKEGYGIRITNAGRTFVDFSPSFEYFACRYTPEIPPLFFIKDQKQVIHILEKIRDSAIKCIDSIIEDDKIYLTYRNYIKYNEQFSNDNIHKYLLFRSKNKNTGEFKEELLHVKRIIDYHIGYLDNYRIFLINEKLFDKDNEDIIIKVLDTIKIYINKFTYICNITDKDHEGKVYYYIGNQNINKYKEIIRKYEDQYEMTMKYPFNNDYSITGK